MIEVENISIKAILDVEARIVRWNIMEDSGQVQGEECKSKDTALQPSNLM